MRKETERKNEKYPVELPSRSNETERSPIVDVIENEIYPLEFSHSGSMRHQSGVHIQSFDNISEVIATEIEPDTEGRTTREL